MNAEIEIEHALFDRATQIYAEAAGKSCAEIVKETAARLARKLLKGTPPLVRGRTRADHTNFLRERILEMRMPRGRLTKRKRSRPMTEATARRYFKVAQSRQGELISGWNALAGLSGVKPNRWVARHGTKHGAATQRTTDAGTTAKIKFESYNPKTARSEDMGRILLRAQSDVAKGLAGNAAVLLRKLKSLKA